MFPFSSNLGFNSICALVGRYMDTTQKNTETNIV